MRVVGYLRVSTAEQDLGLEAQRAALTAFAPLRGWDLTFEQDKASGATPPGKRPGLTRALELCTRGDAEALAVAKLDRVARSVIDTANLLAAARRDGWQFIALDLGIDTSTPEGKLLIGIMSSVAEWERERIAERIREALHAKQARGEYVGGVRRYDEAARQLAGELRARGLTLHEAAASLHAAGVTTRSGGILSTTQVRRLAS